MEKERAYYNKGPGKAEKKKRKFSLYDVHFHAIIRNPAQPIYKQTLPLVSAISEKPHRTFDPQEQPNHHHRDQRRLALWTLLNQKLHFWGQSHNDSFLNVLGISCSHSSNDHLFTLI